MIDPFSLFENRTLGATRSSNWPSVQKEFLTNHPTCAVCDKSGTLLNPLNVHHKIPFHKDPSKELDPENLITLCRAHHLWCGHLGKWASWNVDIEVDAAIWRVKIKERP